MDMPHDDLDTYIDGSPLPPAANHWAPLFLPLLAATMGLIFVGIMLLTLH